MTLLHRINNHSYPQLKRFSRIVPNLLHKRERNSRNATLTCRKIAKMTSVAKPQVMPCDTGRGAHIKAGARRRAAADVGHEVLQGSHMMWVKANSGFEEDDPPGNWRR